jgi:hypothetical protein
MAARTKVTRTKSRSEAPVDAPANNQSNDSAAPSSR